MSKATKILLVEDNSGDAYLLQRLLVNVERKKFEFACVERLSAAINCLENNNFDVILLDLALPDSLGLDTLRQICASAPEIPIIVLTGLDDEDTAIEALREGAQDYLVKGEISEVLLVRAIRYAVERKRLQQNLAYKLSWQAKHDALTGLINRREFKNQLVQAIESAKDRDYRHALCYLDLDQFKVINDTCGHSAGDELLLQATALLTQSVRSTDILARLGGDEFGFLLYQCPLEQAEQIADGLRKLIGDFSFTCQGQNVNISASIGLVEINERTQDLTSVLSAADAACYAAKEKGRNCIHVYRDNDRELARQRGERKWISKINQALVENRFSLYCQKIISLHPGVEEEHYEILLRLVDERGFLIPPMNFIPAAEHYDLMPAIDRWVVSTFLINYERYYLQTLLPQKSFYSCLYTINLSGASLNNDQFLDFLKQQLAQSPILPKTICFEITETTAIANLNKVAHFIHSLKQLGCSFALDDFGSGMSSLSYLKNLPVDYLKIDGSFVKNLTSDRIDYAMVESFNHIAHVMGIKTIAEFVENEAILDKLQVIGIDYAQGYGIARPYPLRFD